MGLQNRQQEEAMKNWIIGATALTAISSIFLALFVDSHAALAQEAEEQLQTTETTQVYSGPGNAFDRISVLQPNVQVTIIPPKTVVIGKGVSIGEGVLIEGKPWVNVRLPDGRIGYVQGSALCTKTENGSVRVALCSP